MRQSKNSVLGTAVLLSFLSVMSKLLGFVREQVIAWRFGAGAAVDSYVAALLIPQVVAGLVGGTIAIAFLPVYSSLKGTQAGKRLVGTLVVSISFATIVVTIASLLFAPQIVQVLVGDFALEQQAMTADMIRILSLGMVFLSITAFLGILFNCHQLFAAPGLAPVLQNLVIVAGLLAVGGLGIRGLATFSALGFVVPAAVLLVVGFAKGLPLLSRPDFTDSNFLRVLKLAGPIVVGSLFSQLYMVIDRRLGSGLEAGSIASLNYGLKLVQLPVGIFVTALATAVFPRLSEYAAAKNRSGFGSTVSSSIRMLAILLIPASVGMIALRYPIAQLAFERGSFDAVATRQTAIALGYYAIGLLGVAGASILVRGFYSLQDTMTPVKIGVATTLVNIALAVVLVRPMGHGGLALANSLSVLFSASVLLYLLARHVEPGSLNFAPLLLKVVVAAMPMGLASLWVHGATTQFGQIVSLGLAVGVGITLYGALLYLFKVEELHSNLRLILTKLGR